MDRPLLYDVFSGAGGASVGYTRAGFEVVGIDHRPQPRYPFRFIEMDAFDFFAAVQRGEYPAPAAWHCSPPCQAYSSLGVINQRKPRTHPRLIEPTRAALVECGLPFVIENVVGAPLLTTVQLCGSSFGLRVRRHRLFETNVLIFVPSCDHARQGRPVAVYGDHPESAPLAAHAGGGGFNRARSLDEASDAMGIDWMTWKELTQAIPPVFCEHIGRQLLAHVLGSREEAVA